MLISRVISWDMGHRVPNHKSKCSSVHGHRYKAIINLTGAVVEHEGVSDQGMVMDFGDIKTIVEDWIDKYLDHAYMGQADHDKELLDLLHQQAQKIFPVMFIPTAENIAAHLFDVLDPMFKDVYGTDLRLHSIELWETPNCSVLHVRGIEGMVMDQLKDKKKEPFLCDNPDCNKDHSVQAEMDDPVVSGLGGIYK